MRPTSIPSGILIHAAIWPQQIWAQNWCSVLLSGRGSGFPSNTMWPGPRPTSVPNFIHLDPSNRLDTVHQRHRQTDRTDRQTDTQHNGPIAQGEPFCKWSPKNILDFNEARDDVVSVASARPYANHLHLAADIGVYNHVSTSSLNFLQAECSS